MNKTSTKSKMRNFRQAWILAIVLSVFSLGKAIALPMNGIYTIGATGTYTTFAAAVTDLTTNGVNGPVIFTVAAGTYSVTSAITIGTITGASATNTITLKAQMPLPALLREVLHHRP